MLPCGPLALDFWDNVLAAVNILLKFQAKRKPVPIPVSAPKPLHSHELDHLNVPFHGELEAFGQERAMDLYAGIEPVTFRAGRTQGLRTKTDRAAALNIWQTA